MPPAPKTKPITPISPEAKAEIAQLAKLAGTDQDPNLPIPVPVSSPKFEYEWPPKPRLLAPMTPSEQAEKMAEDTPYRNIQYGFGHKDFHVPKGTNTVTPRQMVKASDVMRHLRIKQMNAYQLSARSVDNLLT